MNKQVNQNKGFTLIELLVVVAIIGLLSSVVLASLNTARKKSKDAFLREQATQMRNILEQEYNDTGSYTGLQPNAWADTSAQCDSITLTGNYAAKAREICKAIITNSSIPTWNNNPGIFKLYLGNGAVPQSQSYSIMVGLPYKDAILCFGSGGSTSDTTISNAIINLGWLERGCYGNP